MTLSAVLAACAITVASPTLDAVISVESGGNPFAINVNRLPRGQAQPRANSKDEAISIASDYIAHGYNVDLGLMQVNSRNLRAAGVTVADMFDQCKNIRVGGAILTGNYGTALKNGASNEQDALKIALSYYNTGNAWRGFKNGYVAKYYLNSSPDIVQKIAKTSHLGRYAMAIKSDTQIEIPESYFQEISSK